MKKLQAIALVLVLIAALSCNQEKKKEKEVMDTWRKEEKTGSEAIKKTARTALLTFQLEPKSNSKTSGKVIFKEDNGMVVMEATLSGLSRGEHAIHLHEKADCSAADGTSTGGHWNPTFQPHGKWGAKTGYHKGDIGNFTADANGKATVTFTTGEWCMGCNDDTKNIMGKAVIVHQGADDYTSQPSGAAGTRIACVGIIQ